MTTDLRYNNIEDKKYGGRKMGQVIKRNPVMRNVTNSEWVPPMPSGKCPVQDINFAEKQKINDAIRRHNAKVDIATKDEHIHD
jgi:hypothetical protein